MIDARPESDRLQPLLAAMLDGYLADEQAAELRGLLAADPAARRRYVRQVATHGMLQWALGGQTTAGAIGNDFQAAIASSDDIQPDAISDFPSLSPLPSPSSPPFVGGPVFSYMVATVVLCAMLLSAWAYKITLSDGEFVDNPKSHATPMDQMEFVARITGMADCRWADPDTRPYAGSYIPLGRKYELTSGLLEITYTSGAKVVLEGPCEYTVNSDAGGYLAIGKLVARVEKNDELGMMNDESHVRNSDIHHSSFITHHLFAVTTPTAVVTDLGTEFGVEVNKNGGTTSHVFRGSIKVTALDRNGEKQGGSLILVENESVRIEPTDEKMLIPRRVAGNPDIFTRQMPEPPPAILFCDTFENQTDSSIYGFADRYGLNKELLERQSGTCRPVSYVRGGDYEESQAMVQVGHVVYPGKLILFADHEQAGWVALNRNFPRDVEVSVDLDPDALRCVDKSRVPRTLPADSNNNNWLALGIRCQGICLDHRELPLASNSGAVFQIRSNGKWAYFENGKPISKGQVSHAHLYHVVMCVSNNLVNIQLNGCEIDLDANAPGTARTLQGPLSKSNDNFISIGACCEDAVAPAGGTDLNSVDNLTIRTPSRANEKQDPRKLN